MIGNAFAFLLPKLQSISVYDDFESPDGKDIVLYFNDFYVGARFFKGESIDVTADKLKRMSEQAINKHINQAISKTINKGL